MVEEEGFRAFDATNAAQALSILEEYPDIDVLFTDIDMPGEMNGLMLAQEVRTRWPNVAIVVVSGHHRPTPGQLPDRGKFLPKPYVQDAVMRALRETMDKMD